MPFHAVPVLFWDGEMLAQTQAIARFVARKSGLAGSNDVELAHAEALLKKRGGVWFSGNGLTFGDVAVMNILTFMMHPKEAIWKDMNNEAARAALLDGFPLLKAHDARVRAVPEIANWLHNKPEFIGL